MFKKNIFFASYVDIDQIILQSWTIGFSMECFTADFLQFFTKKRQNMALGGQLGTRHRTQALKGFS